MRFSNFFWVHDFRKTLSKAILPFFRHFSQSTAKLFESNTLGAQGRCFFISRIVKQLGSFGIQSINFSFKL